MRCATEGLRVRSSVQSNNHHHFSIEYLTVLVALRSMYQSQQYWMLCKLIGGKGREGARGFPTYTASNN